MLKTFINERFKILLIVQPIITIFQAMTLQLKPLHFHAALNPFPT